MLNLVQKLKINKNTCNKLLKNFTISNNFTNKTTLNKYFSSSNKNYQKLLEELDFEQEDEKDLRYEDQLFFLEREMDKLRRDQKEYGQDYATNDFPEYQQREITTLVDIVKNFDFVEREYFYMRLKDYLDKACHTKLSKQNSFTFKRNIKISNDTSKFNPNNEIIDEILLPLMPYLASDIFIGGGGGAAGAAGSGAADGAKEAAKQEKKEEKPKEKEEYNVQLVGFDAAKKIGLIKEVRGILNLGLKEAKELVEKAPTEIMKKVKKDEAQAIKKKLEENGAKIDLL